MRSLVAIAALAALVSVSASEGELDGKALLCVREGYISPLGFEFRGGGVYARVVSTDQGGKRAVVKAQVDPDIYLTTPTTIEWDESRLVLDRKTLKLNNSSGDAVLGEKWTASCEVLDSVDAMKQAMQAHKEKKQNAIDEQMRGNKI